MSHLYKRSLFGRLPPARALSLLGLMGFTLFVSFRIFTAPTKTVQVLSSPDGSREARLQHVYYYSEPGYKVAVREHVLWHTLFYLPAYTNAPAGDARGELRWSDDSNRLFLEIGSKPVWGYDFTVQSSRFKSP